MKTRILWLNVVLLLALLPLRAGHWTVAALSKVEYLKSDYNHKESDTDIQVVTDTWINYTNTHYVEDVVAHGNFVWIATSGGVLRWNRSDNSYTKFTTADGLRGTWVGAIAIDQLGNIWFGYTVTATGVSKFDGTSWTHYTDADGLIGNRVVELAVDHNGYIWAGTDTGVSKFDGAVWSNYTTVDGLAGTWVQAIAIDLDGSLWFGTGGGVSHFDGSTWTTYTTDDGLIGDSVLDIAIDDSGDKWFAGSGVSHFDGNNWTNYTVSDGLGRNSVYAVAIDNVGNKWFGTHGGGVSKFDGTTWTTYNRDNTANGLVSNYVIALDVDNDGHIWLGTWSGVEAGVNEFDGNTWIQRRDDGYPGDNSFSRMTIDVNGHYWFASFEMGLLEFDGTTWRHYTTQQGLPSNRVSVIEADSLGNVWVGFHFYGLGKYDGDTWTIYTSQDGLPHNNVTAISHQENGTVWVGTSSGVAYFDGSTWSAYTSADGLAADYVWSVAVDDAGNAWFGTLGGGISKFDGTTWTTYNLDNTANGLLSNYVWDVAIDDTGTLWFGTWQGVSRFDGTTWVAYTAISHGLVSDDIRTITIDNTGEKWFSGSGGINRFDGITWKAYTTADGLVNYSVSDSCVDSNGHLWFSTDGGISQFIPNRGTTFYSISGRVQDGVETPIPNLEILVDDGHAATTDVSGYYTITGLITGTYTLTPAKSGYTFTPASRQVTVPPDATGQDFAGVGSAPPPQPALSYTGPHYLPTSNVMANEADGKITIGDHVHLQLPFRNSGNTTLTNAAINVLGPSALGSVGVRIHNGAFWGNDQHIKLTPSTLTPGQIGYADFWIYVTNPDPDTLQSMPTDTWIRLDNGNREWMIPILLEPISFDILGNHDLLADSCLHHPSDPQIQRYAQYAATLLEEASPPSNNDDPDTAEQAVQNLATRVNGEFNYGGFRFARFPDTDLLVDRGDSIGVCRHFADLTAGLLRSLGLPTRYVRGNVVKGSWPGAGHMWNEVDIGGKDWSMVDATNNLVFTPFNVYWAWADRYPLSTASIFTLHSCNSFCIDHSSCTACRVGYEETFPGELYGFQGCMDDVKSNYGLRSTDYLFSTQPLIDSTAISLNVSAPVFVTRGVPFEVVARATNSTTVTLDILTMAVSPYLESGWDTPIYAINPPSYTLSSILPGQAVTVTYVVTPLLAGSPVPLQVAAFSGDLMGVYEQLQNVNEPGTLPNLSLTAGCDQRTIQLGVPITLTAILADEHLHVITDNLSTITATVYATPTQAFSNTFSLAYCTDCQHYAHTLTLPADAPIGRYQVEYTATRPAYEVEHITSSFFVVPALTMTLVADPLTLNMNDSMTLTAQIFDRGTVITQAGVYAEITTPGGIVPIPLFGDGEVYTATLRPADLVGNLDTPLLPGLWTIRAIGNYEGGLASATQSVMIRHSIYLPLVLRQS